MNFDNDLIILFVTILTTFSFKKLSASKSALWRPAVAWSVLWSYHLPGFCWLVCWSGIWLVTYCVAALLSSGIRLSLPL